MRLPASALPFFLSAAALSLAGRVSGGEQPPGGIGTGHPPACPQPQGEEVVAADSAWTNHVGNVLLAAPLGFVPGRGTVRFRLARGGTREIPLTAFPESERTRLSVALGQPPIPPHLAEAWAFAAEASRRAQALAAIGRTSPEACERRRGALRAMLREAVLALPDLSAPHRQALLRQIQTL